MSVEKKIRLIASDIDGTLLPEGTRDLNPEFYDVIQQMIEKDILFVAASGRDLNSIKTVFSPVEKDIIFLANNGGQIMCQGMDLYSAHIPEKMCQKVVDYAENSGNVNILLTSTEVAYTNTRDEEWLAWLEAGYGLEIRHIKSLDEIEEGIIKISVFYVDVEASDMEAPAKEYFGSSVSIMAAGEHWLDFVAPNVTKGSGLIQLQQRLGIAKAETMAFGDNFNDIAMLQNAGISYAVSTAKDEVKASATGVLPEGKDAVMEEIKKWL